MTLLVDSKGETLETLLALRQERCGGGLDGLGVLSWTSGSLNMAPAPPIHHRRGTALQMDHAALRCAALRRATRADVRSTAEGPENGTSSGTNRDASHAGVCAWDRARTLCDRLSFDLPCRPGRVERAPRRNCGATANELIPDRSSMRRRNTSSAALINLRAAAHTGARAECPSSERSGFSSADRVANFLHLK